MFLFITRDIKENKDFEIELADYIFLGYIIWDTKKDRSPGGLEPFPL